MGIPVAKSSRPLFRFCIETGNAASQKDMPLVDSLRKNIEWRYFMLSSVFRRASRAVSPALMKGTKWSPELEPHPQPHPDDVIREPEIHRAIAETTALAADVGYVRSLLVKAKERATLKDAPALRDEFLLGLDLSEAATLLNKIGRAHV
jgi:hypothetical protein